MSARQTVEKPHHVNGTRTLIGRVFVMDGKLVLGDSPSNEACQLDGQEEAKAFDGRTVEVVGRLDPLNQE